MNLIKKNKCIFSMLFLFSSYSSPATANSQLVMANIISKDEVVCQISDKGELSSNEIEIKALEWCVKACEMHGYSRADDIDEKINDEYETDPTLSIKYWSAIKKNTPYQCLPYEPLTKEKKYKLNCLSYGGRVEVTGMISNYYNMGLAIRTPNPSCLLAGNDYKEPGARILNDIEIKNVNDEKINLEDFIGRQITVTGIIKYNINGDVGKFSLVDVIFSEKSKIKSKKF